jgi:hypothetical protein
MAEVAVKGYRDLMRGFANADKQSKRELRRILAQAGEAVRQDAAGRIAAHPHGGRIATMLKTGVRQRGITVRQSLRKTTGLHPEWGAWQMRHGLVPARAAQMPETMRLLEHAMDQVANRFNHG